MTAATTPLAGPTCQPVLADQLAWFTAAPVPATTADLAGASLGDLVELDGRTYTIRSSVGFDQPVGGIDGVVVLGDVAVALGWGRDPNRPIVRYDVASAVRCDVGSGDADQVWEAAWLPANAGPAGACGRVTVTARPFPQTLPAIKVARSGEPVWLAPSGIVHAARVAVRLAGPARPDQAGQMLATVPVGAPTPTDRQIADLIGGSR